MIVWAIWAIPKKNPLQITSKFQHLAKAYTRWVRRRCIILWWRRRGFCYRPDFQRDCGAVVQHLYILLGLLVSRLADLTVYRSGCTEIVHILTGLCTEVVWPYVHGHVPIWPYPCLVVCEHLTSVINILKRYWKHIGLCLTKPRRLVTFIYRRLRNILTYLLTYLLTYITKSMDPSSRTRDWPLSVLNLRGPWQIRMNT